MNRFKSKITGNSKIGEKIVVKSFYVPSKAFYDNVPDEDFEGKVNFGRIFFRPIKSMFSMMNFYYCNRDDSILVVIRNNFRTRLSVSDGHVDSIKKFIKQYCSTDNDRIFHDQTYCKVNLLRGRLDFL